jgi:hypothetical protein
VLIKTVAVPSLRKAQEVSLFIARKVLEQSAQSIFNADQGVQFNSESFISLLKRKSIQVSMDGRGIYRYPCTISPNNRFKFQKNFKFL